MSAEGGGGGERGKERERERERKKGWWMLEACKATTWLHLGICFFFCDRRFCGGNGSQALCVFCCLVGYMVDYTMV